MIEVGWSRMMPLPDISSPFDKLFALTELAPLCNSPRRLSAP